MKLTDHLNIWQSYFADWCLEKIILDRNLEKVSIMIGLDSSDGRRYDYQIHGLYCIGLSGIGLWEEGFLEALKVEDKGKMIDEAKKKIKRNYKLPDAFTLDSVSINDQFYQLTIKLVDGLEVCFVARDFVFEENFEN